MSMMFKCHQVISRIFGDESWMHLCLVYIYCVMILSELLFYSSISCNVLLSLLVKDGPEHLITLILFL